MRKLLLGFISLLAPLSIVLARPILTEEVSTLGKAVFETGVNVAVREDKFNSSSSEYRTVRLPLRTRIGLFNKLDFGFTLSHLSHSLKSNTTKLKGSRPALFSPELKYAWNEFFGLLFIWQNSLKEKPEQEMPIGRGDNYEIFSLVRVPSKYPITLNIGYAFQGDYNSRLGIEDGPVYKITPGDIFQAKTSLEIPLRHAFSVLTELAYYDVQTKEIGGTDIPGSAGQALDGLLGIVWENGGWDIGVATSFGLLNESHTSFDLERGSGDITYHFSLSYRLKARKPYQ